MRGHRGPSVTPRPPRGHGRALPLPAGSRPSGRAAPAPGVTGNEERNPREARGRHRGWPGRAGSAVAGGCFYLIWRVEAFWSLVDGCKCTFGVVCVTLGGKSTEIHACCSRSASGAVLNLARGSGRAFHLLSWGQSPRAAPTAALVIQRFCQNARGALSQSRF